MLEPEIEEPINVLGETLVTCADNPMTGFFRDGKCNTRAGDLGSHTICIEATQEFLDFSRCKGNDLSTPRPELNFTGLWPGDKLCLCAARWVEAYENNMAPRVYLTRTHRRALDIVPVKHLKKYAMDLN